MSIQAIWDLIRFQWLTLVVAVCLGAAAGAGVASTIEAKYSARAEIFMAVANSTDASGLAEGVTYSQQQARNFAAVATRQLVLEPVADDLGGDVTVGDLRGMVTASVPLNTSIISIQATDPSPQRAATVANAVAASLADSIDRLAPEAGSRATSVRVQSVEQATVPQVPTSPNVALLTLLGALLGLTLGLLLLGLREHFRAQVRTAKQASAITNAPVLGIVSRRRGSQRQPMVLSSAPNSTHAEQYRQIRVNLQALSTNQHNKVFVLTSTVAGEGRSTAAANIAATMAAAGTRVCLVEADFHRPALASVLDLDPELGLSEVIAGEAELDEALQPWGPDGLHVLVAGDSPYNPSELLASRQAAECLAGIRDRFEVTVIDAPPVLKSTDATILARMFGGAIMMITERGVKVRDLERAVGRMSRVRAPILGTIISMSNDPSRRRVSQVERSSDTSRGDSANPGPPQSEQGRPVTQLHEQRVAFKA